MNIHLFFSLISINLYFFAPIAYSQSYVSIVTILFFIQSFLFITTVSKGNYLNFYLFFYVSFYFINFFYPSVLYPIDPIYFSFFKDAFDFNIINRATSLAQVSCSFLTYGASLIKINKEKNQRNTFFKHEPVTIAGNLIFLLFIATVGRDFLAGNFTAHSKLSTFILPLSTYLFILSSILFYRDNLYQSNKLFFYASIFFYCSLFLTIGDRGPALSIILVNAGLYSFYVKPLKPSKILLMSLAGFLLMAIVGKGRTSNLEQTQGSIISRGLESLDFSLDGFYNLTIDFVINVWTLYLGYEYVENNGLNWGLTWSKFILGPVPFLQRYVEWTFDISLLSSANIFNKIALGDNPTWGVGTNLVSSVYISFGFLGCIICFFLLGTSIETLRKRLFYNNTVLVNVCYFTILSMSIYYGRTEYLTPLKPIVWTYMLYLLLRTFNLLVPKYK